MAEERIRLHEREFHKYANRGAYHWDMISRNPKKHHPFIVARYQISLELLGSVADKWVLDLGCGDGALTGLIAKAEGRVVGVDPNEEGLELARQQFLKHNLEGEFCPSINHLPSNHFDAVVCLEVIEHVADPRNLLAEIGRVLKPGGVVVVSTPIRLSETVLDKEHIREFYPSEFQSLCADYFQILETRKALPVGLHEMFYISGIIGRLLNLGLKILSCWFNWNCFLRLEGAYRLYELLYVKLKCR